MKLDSNARLRLGVDTGGTFTDLVIEGVDEQLRLYKSPTTPQDPLQGLLDVISIAAKDLDVAPHTLLSQTETLIHGTTMATNAIVERKTAKTALLTTMGHRDILLIREGGGRITPMDYSQEYPDPYIPRSLSYEVSERVYADGRIVQPLDRKQCVETIKAIKKENVEAVAVCLLWSVVNPKHELEIGQLLEEHLAGIPYTLSHQLNPTVREYRRACSTAIDASLKPLMAAYLRNLEARLHVGGFRGRLLILTSSGGMLDAKDVWNQPIHTIGSGPAAAPVAGRHYAIEEANTNLAIVTDAGGTTYDVSLVQDGQIPWTRDSMVGGQKQGFMTGFASVDARSIGAGGGSIGWVDDAGLLHVGPESAGSNPGPACWGRGGERATVTDACVVLGYLDPAYYLGGSMTLDPDAACRAILNDIGEPLGLSVEEAAAALFALACQNMVVAIEEMTLARGVDAADAVLVGGGGGGGLYTATIAAQLGTKKALIPSVAAALSASGALLSELKRDYSATSLMLSTLFDYELANRTLQKLKSQCEKFASASGIEEYSIQFSVEARYPDQVWEIEVPLRTDRFACEADVHSLVQEFHKVHMDLFAIVDTGSPIEIIAWRAEVSCRLHNEVVSEVRYADSSSNITTARRAYFKGHEWVETKAILAQSIAAGSVIPGPAFIETPVTTIIVPPGAKVCKTNNSTFVLQPGSSAVDSITTNAVKSNTDLSGHELALLNSQLESIVLAMRNTLLRTSRSAIMNMARDFACGILTAEGKILTVCEGLPCMTLRGPDLQARYMKECHPTLERGDAFVHNSPYHGNTHPADWTVLMPVVDSKGRHRATVYAKAHMADCGNSVPTTFFASASDVYEEGALIFPCVKVQRNYQLDDDFVRMCRLRIRVPDMWYGDFLAMLGANRIGEKRLQEFLESVPDGTFEAFANDWMSYSDRRMASALSQLPAGKTRVTLQHDPVPKAENGVPINVDLEVLPHEGQVNIDLRDNIDCLPFGMNLSESSVCSAAMAGVFSSLRQQVPLNTGSFSRIDVKLRENCAIGIPRHPFSCSVATTNLSELAGKAVAMGFAELGDGFGLAEVGRHMPPAMAVISGVDPRPGRGGFQNFLCLLVCNGPGAPQADGWLTTIGIGVAGLQHHDSIEIDEMKYPILVRAQYLIADSEGAGRHTGSPSAYVEYEPVDTCIEALFTSDGTINAPLGVRGGHPGAKARQFKRISETEQVELELCSRVTVKPGESLISICTGAGGYGLPTERDPNRVAKDVREGLVSIARAKDVYGVIITADGLVDVAETAELRKRLQGPQTGNCVLTGDAHVLQN